ncbi:MAG TPA: caspase family protein [Myxococcota bacterium]|nr:caspase family protein [Myxococcota bacterium]
MKPKNAVVAMCLAMLALSASSARAEAERLEPSKTWAVVAGVLEWEDPGLSPFPKQERKDQELFDTLGQFGVPAAQRTLLLDKQSTAAAVERAFTDLIARAPVDATLVFYFAGHGVKDQDGAIIFATSDTRLDQLDKTGLHLSRLTRLLDRFKGRRVLLLADCCHSGGLVDVARTLSKKRGALALTSAEASNISTANWTFTQTLIDGLRGRLIHDRDGDGAVELFEVAGEVKDSLKHRESQRYGFANHGVPDELVVAPAVPEAEVDARGAGRGGGVGAKGEDVAASVAPRQWVRVKRGAKKDIARVLAVQDKGRALVEFYDYSAYDRRWVGADGLEPVTLETWPVGSRLDVVWQNQVYVAKVLAVDDGFMRITYPGYESRWDEWISATRVLGKAGQRKAKRPAKVEWNGTWYDAVLNSEENGRYCVSYVGYTSAWDECVEKKRIRLAP